MGTLMGHILPGSFFICFSIWWTFNIFDRYFKSRTKLGTPYRNTVWFQCACAPGIPFESMIKIFFVTIGATGECYTAFHNGVFTNMGNAQHMTMFLFFGLGAIIEIMLFYHHRFPFVPPDLDYVCSILAFTVEGLLFAFHLHGRGTLDIRVHVLMVLVVAGCVLSSCAEMKFRRSVLAALARSFFTLVQGSWFWHVGFILYPPVPWVFHFEQENHMQLMLVTAMFTWHSAGALVFMLGIGSLVYAKYRHLEILTEQYDYFQILQPDMNKLQLSTESDNEGV
jgi:hypothetical protein